MRWVLIWDSGWMENVPNALSAVLFWCRDLNTLHFIACIHGLRLGPFQRTMWQNTIYDGILIPLPPSVGEHGHASNSGRASNNGTREYIFLYWQPKPPDDVGWCLFWSGHQDFYFQVVVFSYVGNDAAVLAAHPSDVYPPWMVIWDTKWVEDAGVRTLYPSDAFKGESASICVYPSDAINGESVTVAWVSSVDVAYT